MTGRHTYANSLRVLGQLLLQRHLDLFELKYADSDFFLQCGAPTPPYLDLVEMTCSLADLKALDTRARANRGATFKLVNFQSLPEMLRAIGHRVDDQEGKLLRVCNADSSSAHESITIEYRTRDKQLHIEELVVASIGEQAMRMYKNRWRRSVH